MFKIKDASAGYNNKRRMLFEINRKVLGKDTPNYCVETGDTVGFACKDAVEYLQAVQILLGEQKDFKSVYVPYIYYVSRIIIGKAQLGNGQGSLISWGAEAIKQGILSSDNQNMVYILYY